MTDELGIDQDSLDEQRRTIEMYRKRDAEEEAACLRGVVAMVVIGYLVGKFFR